MARPCADHVTAGRTTAEKAGNGLNSTGRNIYFRRITMYKLTNEEKRQYEQKRQAYLLTTSDLATMLNTSPEELFRCSVGQKVTPDVYEAVKEWISE
jgi:hypothetical protein